MQKIKVSDGVELAVFVDDFMDAWIDEEEKETILMYHGSIVDSRFFNGIVPILARHYRVVRFDERGMGRSTMDPRAYKPSTERFVNDVVDVADALGLGKFHMYCPGSGGFTGVPFAVAHPHRLHSLALRQTPYQMPRELIERYSLGEESIGAAIRKYGYKGWSDRVPGYRIIDNSKATPKVVEQMAAYRAQNSTEIAAERYGWLFDVDLRDSMKKITVPTLLINSEGSYQTPTHMADVMQSENDNIRVFIMEGGYGQALDLVIPDRLAATLLDFFKSVGAGNGKEIS